MYKPMGKVKSLFSHLNQMGEIVQKNLAKTGIVIDHTEAGKIGKEVRRPMWSLHVIAGYVLIGLYLVRMIITSLQGIAYQSPFATGATAKDKFKSWVYLLFYVLMAISLVTGFMVVNGPETLKEPMEFIHVKSLYYMVTFIILHIGGVLIADARQERGIISKIISGDLPAD